MKDQISVSELKKDLDGTAASNIEAFSLRLVKALKENGIQVQYMSGEQDVPGQITVLHVPSLPKKRTVDLLVGRKVPIKVVGSQGDQGFTRFTTITRAYHLQDRCGYAVELDGNNESLIELSYEEVNNLIVGL